MKRLLILEDGSVYKGEAFGSDNFRIGEIIFQTGMCGYQETISDAAYYGQIVMMTYPAIGNVGINKDDFESMNPALFGLVVREYNEYFSNFRGEISLDAYLKLKGIAGISGVDTRAITKKLRDNSTMKATLANEDADIEKVLEEMKQANNLEDGVGQLSTSKVYKIPNRQGKRIALLDLGVKYGLIRQLNELGCEVAVVPYDISIEELKALRADGFVISSGPGRVEYIQKSLEVVEKLIGEMPILAVGLGHNLLAAAYGCKIDEMKFGSHGNSVPVVRLSDGKVKFTAQNNRYTINRESFEKIGLKETYRGLNDNSIQGMMNEKDKVISVSFIPEAAPGADDVKYVFEDFVAMLKEER